MPSITEQSTVELIAKTFTGVCDRNKTQTMVKVGYDVGYANSGKGHKTVYKNIRVIAAIKAIDDALVEEIDWNRSTNLTAQYGQLKRYKAILDGTEDIKANPTDHQALAGIDRVLRELNASSNQHSSTVNDGRNQGLVINVSPQRKPVEAIEVKGEDNG